MSHLSLDQGVPFDFKQRVTDQLFSIKDFLHLIVKDRVNIGLSSRNENEMGDHHTDESRSENSEYEH